jgi:hypothetical protein
MGPMSAERAPAAADLELVERLAREIDALGRAVGLPFIAVSADISVPEPMVGPGRQPLAETLFRWIDPRWNTGATGPSPCARRSSSPPA